MNTPLLLAGVLSFAAAGVHGIGGEWLVVRHIDAAGLPRTAFGGPGACLRMIRVSWHLVTASFLVLGAALLLCGAGVAPDAARAIAVLGASAYAAFAAVSSSAAVWTAGPSGLLRHPAPLTLTAIALLSGWGALSLG